MTNFTYFEFYPYKKPSAKLDKAIEKVFTDKQAAQLVKLGVVRITIGSSKDFLRKIKDKKSLLGLARVSLTIDSSKDISRQVKNIKNIAESVKNSVETP